MELQTILQILYANDMENVISLAVKLDSKIDLGKKDTVVIQMSKGDLAKMGYKPKIKDDYWINVECEVISFNKYKFKENYLVTLPDGKTKWVTDINERAHEIEPIEETVQLTQLPQLEV
jgi:hypothetical protein